MAVSIAIPVPSVDPDYNERSLNLYLEAMRAVGLTPVVVPLTETQQRVAKLLAGTQGVLLPGSRFDVDPQRYGEAPIPECGEPDPARTAVDELLLQDAFNLHKPVLAICHGTQTLNVWRNGSLVQDLKTEVNHRPGRDVVEAHPVRIAPCSRLASILSESHAGEVQVNSSHHQAIRTPGDNLLVSAVSPRDGVIEAVELDAPSHFVVAVQWHPERTYSQSALSRAIFAAFSRAVAEWSPRPVKESVAPA
ncbi:MAG TPA: gamma-glutamyl-gamma-aminobutyrate hydrolase family protein [Terracidiphilus sp.]|nr:gamma-glutamyl-gamma-aminobutyrate hydrolase family protein [Terracidiphilus sp.]